MRNWLGLSLSTAAIAVLVGAGAPAQTASDSIARNAWNVDAAHSEIGFSVRHFFTPVKGTFGDYEVTFDFDPEDPESASVEVSISVASVDTRNDRRDNHLRSGDWFDAEQYPQMTFRSTSVRRVSENEFVAAGDLTIKETTLQIELPITLLGIMDMPEEVRERRGISQVASFQTGTTIDRGDFEVGVGSWAETATVGADVELQVTIEASR